MTANVTILELVLGCTQSAWVVSVQPCTRRKGSAEGRAGNHPACNINSVKLVA